MGRTYHFDCPHCQYRARVSGGSDDGVNCVIQTIICHDCRELFDVFTRLRKRDSAGKADAQQPKQLFPSHIPIPPLMLVADVCREFQGEPHPRIAPPVTYWEKLKLVCPNSPLHRIEPWKDPGRCPRCGNFMEKNGYPFRLWD